jgi:hypothetical protein
MSKKTILNYGAESRFKENPDNFVKQQPVITPKKARKRLVVDIDEAIFTGAKMQALQNGEKLRELVQRAIENELFSD